MPRQKPRQASKQQPKRLPVCYKLRLPGAAQHLIDVEAHFAEAASASGPVTLQLPAWTPGSYMVRDYSRHIEGLRAFGPNGEPLHARKIRKDAWEVLASQPGDVRVHYRVYGRELSVRTNFVDADFALLQGAATFLGLAAAASAPHQVDVYLPPAWETALCGLEGSRHGDCARFVAADYDALIDSPLLLGNPRCEDFEVGAATYTLGSVGGEGLFDDAAAAREIQQIAAEIHGLWGQVPFARYAFLNVLVGGQGGLEHRHSAVTMAQPTARHTATSRADYHGLMAHELFHAWNIKRLRPVALGPFDYSQENYTPSLWIAEGLTAYYDDLIVRRSGLTDDAGYFGRLAQTLQSLAATPGQRVHALTESSFDAWIKLYRRDENTDNTTVSYYLKGSIVGFVLDARLRAHSGHQRSLDDVMRLAYARYSGATGFSEEAFRSMVSEVSGRDEGPWLRTLLDVPGAVDVSAALDTYGLELRWHPQLQPAAEGAAPSLGLWGVQCDIQDGRCMVTKVRRDAAAYGAGLNVGDELVAIGEHRLPATKAWHDALVTFAQGRQDKASSSLLISRFGRLRRLDVAFTAPPRSVATLAVHPDATPSQDAARAAWLRSLRADAPAAHPGAAG